MIQATPEERALKAFWKKHIEKQHLYRIVAERYVPQIKKHGFTPDKNPFEKQKKDLHAFFDILLRLHKQGFLMMRWWGKPVDQQMVVATTEQDLSAKYIDFTPAMRVDYYKSLQGGALAQTVRIYTEELMMKKPPLAEAEWNLVRKLNKWSRELCDCKNKVIAVRASSPYLEHAEFQYFDGPNMESPFGSFAQFRQAVEKNGLAFYEPYLTGKKLFYLRTTRAIPAREIAKIT